MSEFSNLFKARSHGLKLPREYEDEINRYVAKSSGEQQNVEHRPFPRQVDFWTFCIATALASQLTPLTNAPTNWGKNFIYTNQGIIDNDICSLLTIIAIDNIGYNEPEAFKSDMFDVIDTRKIIELANRLAAVGCPVVLNKLSDNRLGTTPLDKSLEFAHSLLGNVRSAD